MKRKVLSLVLVLAMLLSMSGVTFAEEYPPVSKREGSVTIEIPADQLASMLATGSRSKSFGTCNAFFPQGETYTESALYIFVNDDASIPIDAEVTKVEVYSVRTNVPGVAYYVDIGWVDRNNYINWIDAIPWSSTVSTTAFNGLDPYATWTFAFIATRVIPNPYQDYGAGATLSSVRLTVYYEYN